MKKRNTATRDRSAFVETDTLLVYSIVPDSVYYTRDVLNPSIAKLTISAANIGTTDVTINSFEVELLISGNPEQILTVVPDRIIPVSFQPDTWKFKAIDPGLFEAKPLPGIVIPPKGTLQFELQNIVVNDTAGTTYVTIYELDAGGGEGSKTFNIAKIKSDLKIDDFRADPAAVSPGGITTLRWVTTAAASVTLLPGNHPDLKTTDSLNVIVNDTTTYTLTAYGTGGSVSSQFMVYVEPVRIVSFEAAPATITQGEAVVLTWDTKNAGSCSIEPGLPVLPVKGSITVYPEINTTYILTAKSLSGNSVYEFRAVTVNPKPVPPVKINSFNATPSKVNSGDKVTLQWQTENATTCSITPGFPVVPLNGSLDVYPLADTTYVLNARNNSGGSEYGFSQVNITGNKVCMMTYYDQGSIADNVRVDLFCRNVPVGTTVSYRAIQAGPTPPIILSPVTVTNAVSFIVGSTFYIPANYASEIIYCYTLPAGVNPPPGMSLDLRFSIMVNADS